MTNALFDSREGELQINVHGHLCLNTETHIDSYKSRIEGFGENSHEFFLIIGVLNYPGFDGLWLCVTSEFTPLPKSIIMLCIYTVDLGMTKILLLRNLYHIEGI